MAIYFEALSFSTMPGNYKRAHISQLSGLSDLNRIYFGQAKCDIQIPALTTSLVNLSVNSPIYDNRLYPQVVNLPSPYCVRC